MVKGQNESLPILRLRAQIEDAIAAAYIKRLNEFESVASAAVQAYNESERVWNKIMQTSHTERELRAATDLYCKNLERN